ncbi:MAG: UDP binding domain-containing protein [Planctomycetota bacterium]
MSTRTVGSDSRIGYQFLFPGVGYGGSCFPKDVRAICTLARQHDRRLSILESVDRVNEEQKILLGEKVVKRFGEELRDHTFAVWGLSFKPKTDDMRDAPSIPIISHLLERGAKVRAYDPEAREAAAQVFEGRVEISQKPYAALSGASALLVITEWNEFRRPNFPRMKELLRSPVIFDGRNVYSPSVLMKLGFEYYGIGVRDSSYE